MRGVREFLARFPVLARCSGCGGCLSVCPSYGISRSEILGPRGRLLLGLALTRGQIQPKEICVSFAACLHCGKCAAACPMELPLDLFFFTIARVLRRYMGTGRRIEILQKMLLLYPGMVNFLQPPLALAARLPVRPARSLAFVSACLPRLPFIMRRKDGSRSPARKRILLFAGCLTRNIWPALAGDCVALIEHAGFDVVSPRALGCCGRPQLMRGADFRSGVIRNLALLADLDFQWLLTPCPGCLSTIRNIWPEVGNLPGTMRDQALKLADRAIDVTGFLLKYKIAMPPASNLGNVFWHTPCLMGPEEKNAAVAMLVSMEFPVETGDAADCCGAPIACVGTLRGAANHPVDQFEKELDGKLAGRVRTRAMIKGATKIVTACPGCLFALRREMAATHEDLPVHHIASILAASLPGGQCH